MKTKVNNAESHIERVRALIQSDPQVQASAEDIAVIEAANQPGLTSGQALDVILDGYVDRPALAERDYRIVKDQQSDRHVRSYLSGFAPITYSEYQQRLHRLSNAWRHHPSCHVAPNEKVCVIGFTGIDYATIDLACVYAQTVRVPLQQVMTQPEFKQIFEKIEPATIAVTVGGLVDIAETLVELEHPVRSLVVMDYDERDDSERAQVEAAQSILTGEGLPTELVSLKELIAFGGSHTFAHLPEHELGKERVGMIMHSSGSTGTPKGVEIKDGVWLGGAFRISQGTVPFANDELPRIVVAIAPMNHGMGQGMVYMPISSGGTAYFTLKPDLSTMFEDIRTVRPTYMLFFPRVFEVIYQHYQNEVTRRKSAGGEQGEESLRQGIMETMAPTFLGDRLCSAMVAGAPTSPSVSSFIDECFDFQLMDMYGSTEAGTPIALSGRINRPGITDYKLRDVPELGYYATDKPYPRGELCIKTPASVRGYYKDPGATADLYDEDGYLLLGDIVEELGEDHIRVIDRRKFVLKLPQGEYVAIGELDTRFEGGSAVIHQIYVHGTSFRSYLLAVVVPDMEAVETLLGKNPGEQGLRNLIRDELQAVAVKEELKSFEVPRDFIVEMAPFSSENGFLTSLKKRMRPALGRHYGDQLEAMYEEQERKAQEEMSQLCDDSSLSVQEKLIRLLELDLGIEGIDPSQSQNYKEFGGDSLGSVQLLLRMEEVFGVSLPVGILLDPTGNIRRWTQIIEDELSGESNRIHYADIHGDKDCLSSEDLQLGRFLDEDGLQAAASAGEPVAQAQTVLLTGANGFLGRTVCIQWLEKLASRGGKLICLVRGADDASARERLESEFIGLDPVLEKLYCQLAPQHLEVLAGDIAEPFLGLDQASFSRLCKEVDRISHVGALVNHRLGYEHLFAPNVVGTAEIIRLALTERKKPIDFVSTIAVFSYLDYKTGDNEQAALLNKLDLNKIEGHAGGYGSSKWAAEHLLQNAHREFGLPVNCFRGDQMMPHTNYRGQINAADTIIRLLGSIVETGLAPSSFYPLEADGSRTKTHFDGSCVDVIAAAVVGVSETDQSGYQNYNLNNYRTDDGVSLDSFVDWVESAGYTINRIANYEDWHQRIMDKLKVLPEKQRQQSALDLLPAFHKPISYEMSVSCNNFRTLQQSLGTELPSLVESNVHKWLDDMRLLGLIRESREK